MSMMAYVWLGIALFMGFIEAATVSLVSIWFVGGAVAAFLTALFNLSLVNQIVVFFVVSIGLLLAFRKTLWETTKKKVVPTNADRFLGQTAVVTQPIDNLAGTGSVKIGGMEWTARAQDGTAIPKDTHVTIATIEGVTMYVAPATVTV